jgi:transposase InsO family protein
LELTSHIQRIHEASRQTYGSPRVHAELSFQGVPCCENTVAKLMSKANIVPKAIRQSMSRKGNCWDNAPMESFFHTLKTELVMHCDYQTRTQARSSLFDYMEVFYNRQRRHCAIHYVAPLAFDRQQSPN